MAIENPDTEYFTRDELFTKLGRELNGNNKRTE